MAQAAANPYVVVKHGRREDRAAAYDRFIAACGAFYFDGHLDRYIVTELLASLQAVALRAPNHVRLAANELFEYITSVDTAEGGPVPSLAWMKLTRSARQLGTKDKWELGGDEVVSSNVLLMGLGEFTEVAQLDMLGRWWHVLLTPRGRRWWLARRRSGAGLPGQRPVLAAGGGTQELTRLGIDQDRVSMRARSRRRRSR